MWGSEYNLEICRRKITDGDAVKIIIVTYMFNRDSAELTKLAVASIKKFTKENYEIWIADNNSPKENFQWVLDDQEINFTRNLDAKDYKTLKDSFLNALGLESGLRSISADTKYVVLMHSDVAVAHENWLGFIKNKLTNNVKGVGMLMDQGRIKAMHISGTIFSFDVYQKYNVDLRPSLPDLDVGDDITQKIKDNGFDYTFCRNSHNDQKVIELIRENSIFKDMQCDRAIDDDNNVIFAHLGRGRAKSNKAYKKQNKTSSTQWINNIKKLLSQ